MPFFLPVLMSESRVRKDRGRRLGEPASAFRRTAVTSNDLADETERSLHMPVFPPLVRLAFSRALQHHDGAASRSDVAEHHRCTRVGSKAPPMARL